MKLKGKTALITGGGRGIGKTVAQFFHAEGASIALAARSEDELKAVKAEIGDRVQIFPSDISKRSEVKALVEATLAAFGTIDVLVNAAGIYGAIGPVAEVDFEKWKETFAINLFGTFSMIQETLPIFVKKKKGKIINFSGGGDGPFPNFTAYSSSKVAVVRLTESLAKELKQYNIDVNAIAPGAVNTKILEAGLAAGEKMAGKENYEKFLKQKDGGGVPPEKAAALCVFLASDASDGLSGKLVSAVWDKWDTWTKDDIARLMASDLLTLRRVNPE